MKLESADSAFTYYWRLYVQAVDCLYWIVETRQKNASSVNMFSMDLIEHVEMVPQDNRHRSLRLESSILLPMKSHRDFIWSVSVKTPRLLISIWRTSGYCILSLLRVNFSETAAQHSADKLCIQLLRGRYKIFVWLFETNHSLNKKSMFFSTAYLPSLLFFNRGHPPTDQQTNRLQLVTRISLT